jgi:hypothetical protein
MVPGCPTPRCSWRRLPASGVMRSWILADREIVRSPAPRPDAPLSGNVGDLQPQTTNGDTVRCWCDWELTHGSSSNLSRGNWQHSIGARGTPPALISNAIAPWCLQPCFPLTTRIVQALLEQIRQLCRSRVAAGDRSAVVLPPPVCVAPGHQPLRHRWSIYGARSAPFPLLAFTRLMLPHALLTFCISLSSLAGTAGDGARAAGGLVCIWAAHSARFGAGTAAHKPIDHGFLG